MPSLLVGSLFAGIGGFDLAARWMGWRTAWYSEIDPYACRVMARHFPAALNHGDITAIRGNDIEEVDVLCGGFPCQDISLAGKGAGLAGPRSGLWAHYARLIGELRPRWVVAENVAVLRKRGLDQVLADLTTLGYDAEWHCIPAAAVGAPHRRDRIWIIARPAGLFPNPICTSLADAHGDAGEGRTGARADGEGWRAGATERPDVRRGGASRPDHAGPSGAVVDDTQRAGLEGYAGHGDQGGGAGPAGSVAASGVLGGADPSHGRRWWAAEPAVGRVAHGVPHRVDRLRCLGNAVVPQVPLYLFRQIAEAEADA